MPTDPFLERLRRHAGAPRVERRVPAPDAVAPPVRAAPPRAAPAVEAHRRRRITGDPTTGPEAWLRARGDLGAGALVTLTPGSVRAEGASALARARADAAPGDVIVVEETIGSGPSGWTADETDTVTRLVGAVSTDAGPSARADDLLAPWDAALEPVGRALLGGALYHRLTEAPAADAQTTRVLLATDALLVDAEALPAAVVWAAYRVPA